MVSDPGTSARPAGAEPLAAGAEPLAAAGAEPLAAGAEPLAAAVGAGAEGGVDAGFFSAPSRSEVRPRDATDAGRVRLSRTGRPKRSQYPPYPTPARVTRSRADIATRATGWRRDDESLGGRGLTTASSA